MSYASLIKSSKEKVYNHAIATKILDLMDKLRLSDTEGSKRRWIWELIQNAKDVAYPGKQIDINVRFQRNSSDRFIEFQHNGQPFTIDNITLLIEQVSTKERNDEVGTQPKTTGKFGTGFLSTHLLSEMVEVSSYVKELNLPYKQFSLTLDRSGRNINEIIESVHASLEVLSQIESKPAEAAYNSEKFNTTFKYRLDKAGADVAEEGLTDLDNILPYTMIFLPVLRTVMLSETETHYMSKGAPRKLTENLTIHSIERKVKDKSTIYHFAVATNGLVTITAPVSITGKQITALPIQAYVPKLFCDFPLIGTENFSMPVIINSPSFNPNEPRNGVFLTDREDDRITENKNIVKQALELYDNLLEFAASKSWKNLYNIAYIAKTPETNWLSTVWFDRECVPQLHNSLSRYPIVENALGQQICVLNESEETSAWFMVASRPEVREKLWDICSEWIPSLIPAQSDVHHWYKVLWKDCGRITVTKLTEWIHGWGSLDEIVSKVVPKNIHEWMDKFYDVINLEAKTLHDILSDKYAVIPNQYGKLCNMSELCWDYSIEEPFKDILTLLGEDIRKVLRKNNFETANKYDEKKENNIRHVPRKPEDIITKINKLLTREETENILVAALRLTALFPKSIGENRRQLYFFCKTLFSEICPEISAITYDHPEIWKESDKIVVEGLVRKISNCKNVNTLSEEYGFKNKKTTIDWLNQFISFLVENEYEHYLNIEENSIMPNQDRDFVIKDSIFLDDGEIPETLKDICEKLEYPIRSELLDTAIFFHLSENRTYTAQIVADKITTLVLPRLSELKRSEETRQAFRLLYLWFRDNKELANQLFTELYNARHKLYDDEEVADNMIKAEGLKQLMEEFHIETIDDLRQRIINSSFSNNNRNDESEPLTQDILVSLGIGSEEQFIEAFKDGKLAERFIHTSVPDPRMLAYAHALISRAMTNVLAYLETLDEYDCSEAEKTAKTIISGIKHNGRPIDVVARPSDNGEVIIYYGSEKDVLELNDSELWVENGITEPQQLTLGRILKITGINRIPIK